MSIVIGLFNQWKGDSQEFDVINIGVHKCANCANLYFRLFGFGISIGYLKE